jgi:hypothetical protein
MSLRAPGADVRRPAWQVALWFLGLRAAHACFAPFSQLGLTLVHGFGLLLLLSWWSLALPSARALVARTFAATTATPGSHAWFAAGAGVVALGLSLVEWRDGPFFLQDDNFDQFLPVITWAFRSLSTGVLPLWNPLQFMGAPSADVGVYALTYPPTYLCCWLAELVGQPGWTLDIFALLHLAASYPAGYWAARRMQLSPALAAAAALCFTLSGYHLMAGRSWYYMLPLALWLPLMVGALADFCAGRTGARWALTAGGAAGALFHAGNAQMWTYATLAFVLCALAAVVLAALPARQLGWLAVALLVELALACPLLLPQLRLNHGLHRELFGGGDISRGLAALVLPFGLVRAPHPMAEIWGQTAGLDATSLYASGALLPAVGLLACLLWLVARPGTSAPLLVLCVLGSWLALLLALGRHGGVWPLLAVLPGFSAFQVPYKLLGVFNLFVGLLGAGVLERWLAREPWPRAGAFAICAATSLYTCLAPLPSNMDWPARDYALSARIEHRLGSAQRLLPLAPRRTSEPHPAHWLTHNVPSLYGYASVGGDDSFVEAMPASRLARQHLIGSELALQAYGIDYVLLRTSEVPPSADPWQGDWQAIARRLPRLTAVETTADQVLLEVPDPSPLVFDLAAPARALPFQADGEGVRVTLPASGQPRTLVLNYLHRPAFVAHSGERALPLERDAWGRMRVTVPAGLTQLTVRYRPPFLLGTLVAALLAALAWLAAQALAAADSRARRRSMK